MKLRLVRTERRSIFVIAFLANLAAALWLAYVWRVGNGDALSRTASAFYVLFSRDPHLAAIGFIWPPLPSFLQLPLLPVLRWLGHPEFTGPLLTCLFGAGSLVVLNQILIRLKVGRYVRWGLLAITQIHPAFWYLSASGLAEIVLLFFLLVAVLGYVMMPWGVRPWVIAGLGLGLAIFTRYETLGMIAGMAAAIFIQKWPPWENWEEALEGRLLAVLAVPIYAFGLWMFWNWVVMGDPLYFQHSVYSLMAAPDIARNVGPTHPLFHAWGSLRNTLIYTVTRLTQQSPVFLVAVIIATVLSVVKHDRQLGGLIVLLLSVPALTAFQVYRGALPPWMRYWFYAAPFGALLVGVIVNMVRPQTRTVLLPALFILLLASIPVSLSAMRDPVVGIDEQRLSHRILSPAREPELRARDGYWIVRHDAPVLARVIDSRSQNGLVLLDSETGYGVIMASRHPERLVITSDRDFMQALANPPEHVRYMLLLDPKIGGERAIVTRRYPDLFYEGAPWAILEYDFTETIHHWRLYRVIQVSNP